MFLGLRVNILLWKQKINFVGARHLAALQSDFFCGGWGLGGERSAGKERCVKTKNGCEGGYNRTWGEIFVKHLHLVYKFFPM